MIQYGPGPLLRHDHAEPELPRFPKGSELADRPHEEEYTNGHSGIRVSGMTCGHCVMSVREEVRSLGGVKHVEVSAATGELVVTSEEPIADAAITAAVDESRSTAARMT